MDIFHSIIDEAKKLENEIKEAISNSTEEGIKEIERFFLGKKGKLSELFKRLKELSADRKREAGRVLNELRDRIVNEIRKRKEVLSEEKPLFKMVDVSLPPRKYPLGSLHPITLTMEIAVSIFSELGFRVALGPEVETEYYNFSALNFPEDHPAKDMQDTFYLEGEYLLRTHTSPVQIRVMEKAKPPIAVVIPGRVYRRDDDISHSPMFHQLEGLLVDDGINFSHLKGVLTYFFRKFFGRELRVRFRPSFFPFTEPSAEIDIECIFCGGKGCRVCKNTGFLEIAGAGMVHPNLYKNVGYKEEYTGFAFGMGLDRLSMLKFGINNLRLFFEGDYRLLSKFEF
jgi:phenylalanyl-tRNA synthetase alpha chain